MEIDKKLKGKHGIYKLEINKIVYIGSSVDLKRRLNQHYKELVNGVHKNTHLQRSWNKHKLISYEIIEFCDIEELRAKEDYYIELYDSFKKGFNQSYSSISPLGYKHTELAKKTISLKKKGVKQKREYVEKRKICLIGKKRTEDQKKRISESKKGNKNPMYGRKESEMHKKERMKNMLSKERWNKGLNKDNNDILKKMSESKKGKPAHNRIKHTLLRISDNKEYKSDSLYGLSLITELSISTLNRLKNGTCGKRIKNEYILKW